MPEMTYEAASEQVLFELRHSLASVNQQDFGRLIEAVLQARRVFFVGAGRTLLSLQAIAKRWAHLGIDVHVVGEITEPAITARDILIAGSCGGMAMLPVGVAQKARALGAPVVHIGSNPGGPLKDIADFMVRIPVRTKLELKDEIDSTQPMTSLFEQSLLLLGDIVAMMIIDRKGLVMKQLWEYHANLE